LGNGTNVTSQDTVPFALWCAARHLHDYEEALWTIVAGLGDRDTTCGIVGIIIALVECGKHHGRDAQSEIVHGAWTQGNRRGAGARQTNHHLSDDENTTLVEALAQARRERSEEVATLRAENGSEIATLRKENAELRERIDKQWQMEDELRSKYTESQASLERTKVAGRILGALGEAGVAQLFPKGSAGHQHVRQQIAERILDSITKEQAETLLPVLNWGQQVMLALHSTRC
jgi:hypothetical protein